MTLSILVVDDNEIILKLVTATLQVDGYQIYTANSGQDALAKVAKIRPNMAIIDVMMPDMDGYTLCQRMRQMPATSTIPIMILTAFADINEKLKAFDSGADDFMPKPFQPQELQARVKAHLRRSLAAETSTPHRSVQAKIIAVFSLRGGVGVSSLATNLAIGLNQIWKSPCLLMDLALVNGQSALMLDLPLRNTWADLGKSSPDEIDEEVVQKVLLHHETGTDLLAAPQHIADTERITAAHVTKVLDLVSSQYRYIVLDMPHDFSETTLAGFDKAQLILLLLSPELASIRCASGALDVFKDLGYPDENIQLVLNWTFEKNGLARKEIEGALQKNIKVTIPYLQESLISALMLGKPSVLDAETSTVGSLFEDLAYYWSNNEDKLTPPTKPTPSYLRIIKRTEKRSQKQNKK